jgi:putative oxidoreductase
MPFPVFTADFVGGLETVGGLPLMAVFLSRLIAIPFVIEMIVAMLSTKISLYLGTSPLPLPPAPPKIGVWAVLHEIRSEYAQMMVVLYLLINGPGKWAFDAVLARLRTSRPSKTVGLAVAGTYATAMTEGATLAISFRRLPTSH